MSGLSCLRSLSSRAEAVQLEALFYRVEGDGD
jgi:hypothetical protein